MGAWIETLMLRDDNPIQEVAPCMGAWIETAYSMMAFAIIFRSHPVWVRGLKPSI